jgi:mycolipenoyl-CoA---2-(long-chain-fatty acyl)-trehalose mycolipenoyltransferase / long-chain-acyl-CoA---trehalose acyltransferase
MSSARVQIRRSRRTDFTGVMNALAAGQVAVPPPDRAARHRFRNIVADLGADFYLALVDDTVAGLLYVTYARQLARPPQARLDHLVVAEPFRRRGIGSALLAFAQQRARKRGCGTFSCALSAANPTGHAFLQHAGLQSAGNWFAQALQSDAV